MPSNDSARAGGIELRFVGSGDAFGSGGRFRCRRVILTHMGPEMLSRLGDVDIEHAEDGGRVAL